MRRRFHLSWHDTIEDARASVKKLKEENPDKEYQIRRKKRGFDLMERLTTQEAGVINAIRNGPRHRRPS